MEHLTVFMLVYYEMEHLNNKGKTYLSPLTTNIILDKYLKPQIPFLWQVQENIPRNLNQVNSMELPSVHIVVGDQKDK